MARILLIQGHPDPHAEHFGHALAAAYIEGARAGGHETRLLTAATLDVPMLASKAEWEKADPPEPIRRCQEDINWAEHLVILFPLWLGGMPAQLKAVLEQTFRPHFAGHPQAKGGLPPKVLRGKTARIIVTMGMPALIFRWYFGASALKTLERGILRLLGIRRIRETLIGRIESGAPTRHHRLLRRIHALGQRGE